MPRRSPNQLEITSAVGTKVEKPSPRPSIVYPTSIGPNEFARLAATSPRPASIAPATIMVRASTRSRSLPASGELTPEASASTANSSDTRVRSQPN